VIILTWTTATRQGLQLHSLWDSAAMHHLVLWVCQRVSRVHDARWEPPLPHHSPSQLPQLQPSDETSVGRVGRFILSLGNATMTLTT
jgi:hypothetical protein